ncbi:hypothetical protein [Amycolatopsis sp. NPDC051903]|uniref:hypothetical protein n=1 Tax=Amycolatopsis sp. NPDC051903 TaxID=3363936 RepID=UPI0037ACCB1F
MSEDEAQPANKVFCSDGHKRVAAVAAPITAVAGIFIGRSSAPDTKNATPVTATLPPVTTTAPLRGVRGGRA